jgi:hypothetical protein
MTTERKPIQVFDLREGRQYKIPLSTGDVIVEARKGPNGKFCLVVIEAPPGICMKALTSPPE